MRKRYTYMKEERYKLNWKKYSWREFEQICFEYIKECYSAKFYNRTLTRAQKDKGRDIIIKGRKTKFEAWGECKDHNRNIGLETIGKNVVLALSHQINQAIFFSVTLITLNTKIEILNVAQLHGFEVLFLDGNELNKAILSCHKVSRKYFRQEYQKYIIENSNPLWIDTYLSEYPFAEDAKNNSKQQYHLENGFQVYLHLFIKNTGSENVDKLHIELNSDLSNDIIFYKKELSSNTLIASHTDLLYTFQGLVFSPKNDISIPCIKICYSMPDGTHIKETIEPGTIDASDVWKAPYINSDSAEYIKDAYNILEYTVPEKYVRILYVYGKSGIGKSRLMSEIENKAYEYAYRVIHIDFREINELYAMRDFIFSMLGLPAKKHKVALSLIDFQKTFEDKIDHKYVSILYSFLYEANADLKYEELVEVVIELLFFSSERNPLLVGIDNIQELSPDLQVFFLNIVEQCKKLSISICFLFSQNIERFPKDKNVLVNYLNLCGDKRENYVLPYECGLLNQPDAVTLMQQLLHLFSGNRQLIADVLGEEGASPMDILLLSKTLAQTDGLFSKINGEQYIKNAALFSKNVSVISVSTDKIIENRFENLKTSNSDLMKEYRELFCLIYFFDGNLPMEIFEACAFDKGILPLLNENLLTKINHSENIITFYHEKIYVYWGEKYTGVCSQRLKKVYDFYKKYQNENIVNSYIFLKTIVALKKVSEAISEGIPILEKYKRENQNIYVCKTSDVLLSIIDKTQKPIEYFRILFQKADFLLERVNISEAEKVFEEAKEIISTKYTIFTEKDVTHFYHKYVNQKLHTLQFDKAIDALHEFEKIKNSRSDAPMIINDRYCVALYSLGKEVAALEKVDKVIKTAEENNDNIWLSIAYSDKVFTYYFNSRNIEQISYNFSKAIEYYLLGNDTDDISRRIEIYIQKTIVHILKRNDEQAMETIQKAVQIAEKVNYGYLLIPAININVYLLLKKNDIDNALQLLEKAFTHASTFSNTKALISIYNNYGNIYLLKDMPRKALDSYCAGFNILQENCLPQNSTRFIGLLCNIIKLHVMLNKLPQIMDKLSKYQFQVLEEYTNQCRDAINNDTDISAFCYGVLGYNGYDYLF